MIRFASLASLALSIVAMTTYAAEDAPKKPEKVLRHVVLVKFKDDLTKDQVKEVVDAFRALPKKIDAIIEGHEKGEFPPVCQRCTYFVSVYNSRKSRTFERDGKLAGNWSED